MVQPNFLGVGPSGGATPTGTFQTVRELAYAVEGSVVDGVETTIVTLAAVSYDRFISQAVASCRILAEFRFYKNAALVQTISGVRNAEFNFGGPFIVEAGDIIDVKAIHYKSGETPDIEAVLYGEDVP